jgi:glucosamine-6-phosphate deaminase
MEFKVFDTYEEASKYAADLVAEVIKNKKDAVLGLATGSTPIGIYKELIRKYANQELDFNEVKSVNLDEYIGIDGNHPQSYRYFMNKNLFDHINIEKKNTYVPNGIAGDLNEEAKNYDKLVKSLGGIDIQILGIGANGHIGFNEPASTLHLNTHVTNLKPETITANARFFESENEVPTKAITMGIGAIMNARKIVLIATGTSKAEVVRSLKDSLISTNIPATILKTHQNVVVILDKKAAGLL